MPASSGFFSWSGSGCEGSGREIRDGAQGDTLGGLPRFFLTGGSEVDASGTAEEDDAAAPDFLFLLPLGRPRPLLAGGFGSLDSATAGGGRNVINMPGPS